MAKRRYRTGRSTLSIISGLLIASAFIRIGVGPGAALAEAANVEEVPIAAPPSANTSTNALLEAFQRRETRLAEREAQLQARIQALNVVEAEVTEKLASLEAAERTLAATIAMADGASATDLEQLTTVYENMKPKEAAAVFEEMSPEFAAGFLGMMRPDAAALIMTQLEPETAYSFSVVLAGRNANAPTE